VQAGAVDVSACVGGVCPICGTSCGYRPIPAYRREVIERFPVYRKGAVLVARAQCRRTLRTFSLLPHPLAPYHRYTVDSMVSAVVLAGRAFDSRSEAADALVRLLEEWTERLGLPRLGRYGLTEAGLLDHVVAPSRGSSRKTNPVALTDAEARECLARRL
jgi:hypothetical protein